MEVFKINFRGHLKQWMWILREWSDQENAFVLKTSRESSDQYTYIFEEGPIINKRGFFLTNPPTNECEFSKVGCGF